MPTLFYANDIYQFACTFDERSIAKAANFRWQKKDKYWWTDNAADAYKLIAHADEKTKAILEIT